RMQRAPHEIKAGLITSFTIYCEWPSDSKVADTDTPFTVGAFEKSGIMEFFTKRMKTRSIKGKKVVILLISDYDDIKKCDLLFVNKMSKKDLAKVLKMVDNLPILTISDTEGYEKKGLSSTCIPIKKVLCSRLTVQPLYAAD
ncbi:MAG: YfiR family protein, partial [bacterium]|nr:YfiR family protein [bacterium]